MLSALCQKRLIDFDYVNVPRPHLTVSRRRQGKYGLGQLLPWYNICQRACSLITPSSVRGRMAWMRREGPDVAGLGAFC